MRILGGPGGNAAFLTKDFRQAHNFKDTPEMREQLTRELRPTKIEFVTPTECERCGKVDDLGRFCYSCNDERNAELAEEGDSGFDS